MTKYKSIKVRLPAFKTMKDVAHKLDDIKLIDLFDKLAEMANKIC